MIKKLLFILIGFSLQAQTSTKPLPSLAIPQSVSPNNFVFVDGNNGGLWGTALPGSIAWLPSNITGFDTAARNAITLTTTGSGAASYSGGVINIPTPLASFAKGFSNNVSRSLNSNFTISTTRDCNVSYSINLSCTNPLLAGSSSANAFLEYSTDAGATWITVSDVSNASSVALAVAIAITQPSRFVLSGLIPANALVRIRSTTSGTASVTYGRGQEVLL